MLSSRSTAFLTFLDSLYTPVVDRLDRFAAVERSPQLTAALLADFCRDSMFIRDAARLHDEAIHSHFGAACPVTDASRPDRVILHTQHSIEIRFLIFLFTEKLGNSATHAAYTLTRPTESPDLIAVSYGCGLRDDKGQFWYPRTDKYFGRLDPFPEQPNDWVVYVTKTYGRTSLAHYFKRKRK